jgi:hypothetical protein
MITAVGVSSTGTETEAASTVILIPVVFFPTNQADDLPSHFWQPCLSVELDLLVNRPDQQKLKLVSPVFPAVFESRYKRNKPQDILQSFRILLPPEGFTPFYGRYRYGLG